METVLFLLTGIILTAGKTFAATTPNCSPTYTYNIQQPQCQKNALTGKLSCVKNSTPVSFSCSGSPKNGICIHNTSSLDYGCTIFPISCKAGTDCPTTLAIYHAIGVKQHLTRTGALYGTGETCVTYSYSNSNYPSGRKADACQLDNTTKTFNISSGRGLLRF